MAGSQVSGGDGIPSNLAGMSKTQLYDIMCQVKTLIEQNQQQAREILVQNPTLTRALFQAQIMLGMVQPKKAPAGSLNILPPASTVQQSNAQASPSLSAQPGFQEPARKPQQDPPAVSVSCSSIPSLNHQSQTLCSQPLQPVQPPKGPISIPSTMISHSQASQIPNLTPSPHHSVPQPPSHIQSQMSAVSNQLQKPMQASGFPHMPPQPPLPPQGRPLMPGFPHQVHPQMGPNLGFQQSAAPQLHHSQPMFHSVNKHPASMGPQYMQGPPPLPSQAPPQSLYQMGGSRGAEFGQIGISMQSDRGAQLPGPPAFPGQMSQHNPPTRLPGLTPEMEQAVIQQVRNFTPEQINALPPDQRAQILQLQQMLLHQ